MMVGLKFLGKGNKMNQTDIFVKELISGNGILMSYCIAFSELCKCGKTSTELYEDSYKLYSKDVIKNKIKDFFN